MRKLLIVGSSAIHTYNYINLIKDSFDDILLLTNNCREGFDVNTIEMNFRIRLSMFRSIREIRRVAHEYNPSVVHIHQANSYAFLTLFALRNFPVPKILTAWGSDVLLFPEINYLYKKMVQYALENADVITSDSLYMASVISKLCRSQQRIVLVSYGVQNIAPNLDKEKIIFSNRMHKDLYNIDKILVAFQKFSEKNSSWKLVIAGSGEEDETQLLVDLTKRLGIEKNVIFTGWLGLQENLAFYNRASIYISIPDSDATSISLLEAISNNCICFVSNLPANCEHVLDHVNGFIENNLSDINLDKYHEIDKKLLRQVNGIRSIFYSDEHCRNLFNDVYDNLISE